MASIWSPLYFKNLFLKHDFTILTKNDFQLMSGWISLLIGPTIFLSRKPNIFVNISMSLTKVGKLFNAVNDASNGYQTRCIDRWNPIKTHITKHEALPREALKPQ